MPEYIVKENHRTGKSVSVDLILDGVKVYDRYVSTDAWGIDPDEVAAELISYWDKECAKVPEDVVTPEIPIEVSMTSEAAIIKKAQKIKDEQVKDSQNELEGR